jgi:Chalcone isomerase-like
MNRTALILSLALLVGASGAMAAEVGGIKLDDKVAVAGQDLVLNGAGIRTKLMFKVYVGALYLPAKATSLDAVLARSPRRVQLTLLRDLSADDLVGALVEGLENNSSPAELATLKPQTDQLVSIMKSIGQVKTGGVVTLDFIDGETRIAYNGQAKGTIAGAPFNAALTRVWLGDKPAQTDLRKAMLGG